MGIKKTKGMAMATATFVLQYSKEATGDSDVIMPLERAIDATDVVRRVGEATTKENAELVEVRCEVEYGPLWANEADMRRHLERQTEAIAVSLGARESAVFNIVPTELATSDLDEVIGRLTARSNDIDVPLALRKQLTAVVTRLRRGVSAGRVRRLA